MAAFNMEMVHIYILKKIVSYFYLSQQFYIL